MKKLVMLMLAASALTACSDEVGTEAGVTTCAISQKQNGQQTTR